MAAAGVAAPQTTSGSMAGAGAVVTGEHEQQYWQVQQQ